MKTLSEQVEVLEDLVDELRLKRKGLQIEVDNLAMENGHFANFLERMDYSPCEIDNISNGWYTDRTTDLDKDKRIKELERKLMTIMNVANDANEED
jgi:Mg2+ and Co2+ transporter CorA